MSCSSRDSSSRAYTLQAAKRSGMLNCLSLVDVW
jgi:hypothetical protein